MVSTPKSGAKTFAGAVETKSRLEKCWKVDITWELYPTTIHEVWKLLPIFEILISLGDGFIYAASFQGCAEIGKAMSMPPTAVLGGILVVVAFCMSHGSVSVPGTERVEPILLWVSIGMPTGSGKSPLYKFLLSLMRKARARIGLT